MWSHNREDHPVEPPPTFAAPRSTEGFVDAVQHILTSTLIFAFHRRHTPTLIAAPVIAMEAPAPTLADVLDLIAPHLDDQRDRCRVQATCRGLRNAGLRSEVVNRLVVGRDRSDEERRSFLLWLGPRAHAVRRLNYCASCM